MNIKRLRIRLDIFILEEKELERAKKTNNVVIDYRIRRFKKIIEFITTFEIKRETRINTLY